VPSAILDPTLGTPYQVDKQSPNVAACHNYSTVLPSKISIKLGSKNKVVTKVQFDGFWESIKTLSVKVMPSWSSVWTSVFHLTPSFRLLPNWEPNIKTGDSIKLCDSFG